MKKHTLYQKVYKYQFSYSFGIQQVVKKSLFFFISQLHFHQHLRYFLFLLPKSSYFKSFVGDAASSNHYLAINFYKLVNILP
jgi:hypothetical protein